MERETEMLSFEDAGRILLANARREYPTLAPDMRRWDEGGLPAAWDQAGRVNPWPALHSVAALH
jgi:hypothetical protein